MKRLTCLIKGHRLLAHIGRVPEVVPVSYQPTSAKCTRCERELNFWFTHHWNWLTKRIA